MSETPSIAETLALMAPNCLEVGGLVRVGNSFGDGGYVLADRLAAGQAVYSYGISNEISFDLDLARRGMSVFMYDHTIDAIPVAHEGLLFFRQGVADGPSKDGRFDSLENHVLRNGHGSRADLILKMDVEGAEWDVLESASDATLSRFEQIVFEAHDLNALAEPAFRRRIHAILGRLSRLFALIHVHANNVAAPASVGGLTVPPLLEFSYLRRDLGRFGPWASVVPTELDVANVPGRDLVLAFYPFLPVALDPAELARRVEAATRRAEQGSGGGRPIAAVVPIRGANIAREGVCAQSSLSPWSRGPLEAGAAAEGRVTGGFAFHTDIEIGPWWQVDFGQVRRFDEILCFNRLDACADRARGLIVEISVDGGGWEILHEAGGVFGGADGAPLRVERPGGAARFVRVRLPGRQALHLDAVAVCDWSAAEA